MSFRNMVLSIAGYDPSAGAGVLADVKTCEQIGVYALAAISALTYQTDNSFKALQWLDLEQVISQIAPLLDRFSIDWVKIGLLADLQCLNSLVDFLKETNPKLKIVWDPILSSSSGYTFHFDLSTTKLKEILPKLFLITPNFPEAASLAALPDAKSAASTLSMFCKVLLKGGHAEGSRAVDYLYENGDCREFSQPRLQGVEKHGSGCVYSAALTANLAKGASLVDACSMAQEYTRAFLASSPGLIGYHHLEPRNYA